MNPDVVSSFASVLEEEVGRRQTRVMIGVRAENSSELTLEDCSFFFGDGPLEDNLFGIGVFATGDCGGLTARRCQFTGNFTPTVTWGIQQPDGLKVPTFTGPTAPSPAGLRGAAGCLVSPYVRHFATSQRGGEYTIEQFTAPVLLNDATFVDNSFSNLTLAISAMAEIDTLRIHANTVVDCIAGFWIKTTEARQFEFANDRPFPFDGDAVWLDLALVVQECFLLLLLGLVYPPADGTSVLASPPPAIVGPASIFITENDVAASVITRPPLRQGSIALAVLTGPPGGYTGTQPPPADQLSGLVISDNRFRGRIVDLAYPTAMLVYSGRCAATGNLISAVGGAKATSLYIVPEGNQITATAEGGPSEIQAPGLTVTGNVLEGGSNLATLFRPDVTSPALPAPFNTWLPFNASS
jgi:hypothetical protein